MFSKLDGYGTPEQIVKQALQLGLKGLAITDHASTSSHPKLEMACNTWGKCSVCDEIIEIKNSSEHSCINFTLQTIKPIYGVELYLNSAKTKKQKKNHITLLAKNLIGYKNLLTLASLAHQEDYFYYMPCVDLEDVIKFSDGIVVLSGCLNSISSELISMGNIVAAEELLVNMNQNIENFYIEIQPLNIKYKNSNDIEVDSDKINGILFDIAERNLISVVATNDTHYVCDEDRPLQHFLAMVHRRSNIKEMPNMMSERCVLAGEEQYKKWLSELNNEYMTNYALINQDIICDIIDNFKLPKVAPMKWNSKSDDERYNVLVDLCNKGWAIKRENITKSEHKKYITQGRYELSLIKEKGFYDYFLIVSDMVRWAKENNILVGPARGSVGASLIAWLTNITEIDPIKFNLLFERFLDPSRTDPPDIDLDFQDDRREEIKEYMRNKWGLDKVANVAGYTLYHDKGLLDDIGRCYNYPLDIVEGWKRRLIEEGGGELIEDILMSIENIPENIINILGQLRNYTVHAAGLVISSEPLSNITTIMKDSIALDKRDAEYLNLLKIDVLSLTTLRVISLALNEIKMNVKQLYNLPLNIVKVFDGFKTGDMQGIFQYSGTATRNVLIKVLKNYDVKTANLQELLNIIIDVNTLSRPASLNNGSTNRYINNQSEHVHEIIDKHTQDTRGQIIYQEQIMRVLREGGLDWEDVTAIRKLMTKHEGREKIEGIRNRFFNGVKKKYNVSPEESEHIWSRIGDEGAYGFNIAHCVAYSLIAYYLMWIKMHHPLVFYWANMMVNAEDDGLLREFAQTGGKILEVRFGKSQAEWTIDYEQKAIRAGYKTIKGIGDKTADKIVLLQESHKKEVVYVQCPKCKISIKSIDAYIDHDQGNSVFKCSDCDYEFLDDECEYTKQEEIVIGENDFTPKIFQSLMDAGAFKGEEEVHDYLGLAPLLAIDNTDSNRTKIIDLQGFDICNIVAKVSAVKIKSLREYYKKNNKDYSEVKDGEKEKYVNMKVYDETGTLDCTISRYKMAEEHFIEMVNEFNENDLYEFTIEYSESKSKAYIMNVRRMI
jgi:DNA polymerase-3 subunit alpha